VIAICGSIDVPAETRDALVAEIAPFLIETRGRPGCVEYCISADPAVPTRLSVLEIFESLAALEDHLAHGPQAVVSGIIGKYGPTGSSVIKYRIDASAPMIGPDGRVSLEFPET
jgi:quinol monooxygenase YgiN